MTRRATGLCLAAVFGAAATIAAQTTTAQPSSRTMSGRDQILVTGCLQKDAGGYILSNAHLDTSDRTGSTSGASTTTGGTTTGTTGGAATTTSTTGTSAKSGAMSGVSTWKLAESNVELDKHVGHRVQITGKEIIAGASTTTTAGGAAVTGTAGATTATSGEQRSKTDRDAARTLNVTSLKMISSSCS